MSYNILYRSMFAKVGNDEFIPMIEIGDSNTYDAYSPKRRSRSWQNWSVPGHEGKIILTRKEILEGVSTLIKKTADRYVNQPTDKYDNIGTPYWTFDAIYKNYGWLTGTAVNGKQPHQTTARMVENFIKRGFEQCVDVANLENWFPLQLSHYDGDYAKTKGYLSLNEFLADVEKCDTTTHWVSYEYADTLWKMLQTKRK